MLPKTFPSLLLALCALSGPTLAHAANFADLQVVQEAAKTGMWTMSTAGTLPDGKPFPGNNRTVCATREEVLKSLANPFMWNEKTGVEDQDCPTSLTTNTSTIGVASMQCKPQTIQLPGQSVAIPSTTLTTEFRRTGKQNWTVKTGNVVTTITYHGESTASCVASR